MKMTYAVEVITFVNRGSRHERQYATGQYAYFSNRADADLVAKRDDVKVIVCDRPGALEENDWE
jgi:membrane-bound inhibitor of C-type lysozyme